MKLHRLTKVFHLITMVGLLITTGCATAFVRSNSTPHHVFPATAFDGEFFWQSGVKGEPLFVAVDSNDRMNPAVRFAFGVGSIIDLPFSIAFDTLLLPLDLSRQRPGDTDDDREPVSTMK